MSVVQVAGTLLYLGFFAGALDGCIEPKNGLACALSSTPVAVLLFKPKYRLGPSENYLFLLSKNIFSGSKYPKIKLFNFEKAALITLCMEAG